MAASGRDSYHCDMAQPWGSMHWVWPCFWVLQLEALLQSPQALGMLSSACLGCTQAAWHAPLPLTQVPLTLLGTYWNAVVPRGTASTTKWAFVLASAAPTKEGWLRGTTQGQQGKVTTMAWADLIMVVPEGRAKWSPQRKSSHDSVRVRTCPRALVADPRLSSILAGQLGGRWQITSKLALCCTTKLEIVEGA